jgi:hypothetical protein
MPKVTGLINRQSAKAVEAIPSAFMLRNIVNVEHTRAALAQRQQTKRTILYFPFAAASSWRIFAIVAAEGSLRFLFFTRRLVFVV